MGTEMADSYGKRERGNPKKKAQTFFYLLLSIMKKTIFTA
jgi:hypothetical protein